MPEKNYNMIVSGQPGSGGSTTAMLVALITGQKYLYAGGVLKHWVRSMDYDPSGNGINDWEDRYGVEWDNIWEAYAQSKLNNGDGYLYEGKTAGLAIKKKAGKILPKIMIIADLATRNKRAGLDGRTETIAVRDEKLVKRWFNRFEVNMFDRKVMDENYNEVIDNTDLSIAETVKRTLECAKREGAEINYTDEDIDNLMKRYNTEGEKKFLERELKERGLFITPEEIFAEMQILVPDEFNALSPELREAIMPRTTVSSESLS